MPDKNGNPYPWEQAARDNYAYTGEAGARDTTKTLLWNKTPDQAAPILNQQSAGIAGRTAQIATQKETRGKKSLFYGDK